MMRAKVTIKPDGQVHMEVTERTEGACNTSLRVLNGVGKELSTERTGPEDDKVYETQS